MVSFTRWSRVSLIRSSAITIVEMPEDAAAELLKRASSRDPALVRHPLQRAPVMGWLP